MRNEFQIRLFESYPKIFRDRDLPLMKSATGRGIVCDDGWYPLIDALCATLQACADSGCGPQVVVSQVKEKFGSLRFHVKGFAAGRSAEQYGMLLFAQYLSERICEVCGAWKSQGCLYGGCSAAQRIKF
mgnify:CR=1 FL=1